MKLRTSFFIVVSVLWLLGCANNDNVSLGVMDEAAMTTAPESTEVGLERKLIKEGSVSFETNDIKAAKKGIVESVEKYKAYISADQEYKSDNRISNTIVVRVAAENFDSFLNDATKGVQKFDNKNIQIKDVTEEFLDVEVRLKTKKELEKRYLELLQEAANVTEMLAVEAQIGQLRTEIEAIEGRMKYLQSQVSLSTLTIDFYQIIPDHTQFGNKFKNGFKNGWDNLIWLFVGLINIWPFVLLIGGLVFWLFRRGRNKRRARRDAKNG